MRERKMKMYFFFSSTSWEEFYVEKVAQRSNIFHFVESLIDGNFQMNNMKLFFVFVLDFK